MELFTKNSVRMRDMIKSIRLCKTAAEERAVIAKECANIRTAFKDEDNDYRHRNVAKLLFIQMLGYPTQFGQMECIKLVVSPHYFDKRVGYLGLMLLLDEKQEVLTLVTNSLKNDLCHPSQFVVGLALCAIANISSPGIARDLAPEVEKLLSSTNPYLKKKATLCAVRIIRKVPELVENFAPKIKQLLAERNHGVLMGTLSLMQEIIATDVQHLELFRKLVPLLVRILKSLVLSGYAPEYDVSGVTDPFLQVKILRLLSVLGKGDKDASDAMSDILAQVATNTEGGRNVGNSILYECVLTIMTIESEGGLRVLAINQLGRFLLNRDNNIRYVALNTLSKVVGVDTQAVQRHRNTIVDCLKDNDVSIKKRALDLVYALVNESNIQVLIPELLDFLDRADAEFKSDLTTKICVLTEKFSPSTKWRFDTILKVLSSAGNYITDDAFSNMVALVGQSSELHSYAAQKLYVALSKELVQQPLVQLGLWSIGEFGNNVVNGRFTVDGVEHCVTEKNVLDLLDSIHKYSATNTITREFLLTALIKLGDRFQEDSSLRLIHEMLSVFQENLHLELQQRACEYAAILQQPQGLRAKLLEQMPPLEIKSHPAGGAVASSGSGSVISNGPTASLDNKQPSLISEIDDLLNVGGPMITPGGGAPNGIGGGMGLGLGLGLGSPSPAQPQGGGGLEIISELLGPMSTPAPALGGGATMTSSQAADPFSLGGGIGSELLSILSGPSPALSPLAPGLGAPSPMPLGGPVSPSSMVPRPGGVLAPGLGGPAPLTPGLGALAPGLGGPAPMAPGLGGPAPLTPGLGGPAPLTPGLGGPVPLTPGLGAPAPLTPGIGSLLPASAPGMSPGLPPSGGFPTITAYQKGGLTINMAFSKQPNNSSITIIDASVTNSLSSPFTNFQFLTALPKYIKLLQMPPPSDTTIPPNNSGKVTQTIKIQNTLHGQKNILMKIKLEYVYNGEKTETTADVFNFPPGL